MPGARNHRDVDMPPELREEKERWEKMMERRVAEALAAFPIFGDPKVSIVPPAYVIINIQPHYPRYNEGPQLYGQVFDCGLYHRLEYHLLDKERPLEDQINAMRKVLIRQAIIDRLRYGLPTQ